MSLEALTRPLRADAQRNRARVLEAAAEALVEAGLDAQMEDVARRAGVGVGTVYRHFPTKDALVDAVVLTQLHSALDEVRTALDAPDAGEAFRGILRDSAERQMRHGNFCPAELALVSEGEDVRRAYVELHELTAKLVRRAQRQGTLRRDLRPDEIPLLFCSIGQTVRASAGFPGDAWRRYVEIMLDGLKPPA